VVEFEAGRADRFRGAEDRASAVKVGGAKFSNPEIEQREVAQNAIEKLEGETTIAGPRELAFSSWLIT
jgi:hypothetical protein